MTSRWGATMRGHAASAAAAMYETKAARPKKMKLCENGCGATIPVRGGKRYCAPCKDAVLEAQLAARRKK